MFIEAGSTYEVTFCTLYRSKQNFNLAIHKNEYIELSILYNKCFDKYLITNEFIWQLFCLLFTNLLFVKPYITNFEFEFKELKMHSLP